MLDRIPAWQHWQKHATALGLDNLVVTCPAAQSAVLEQP